MPLRQHLLSMSAPSDYRHDGSEYDYFENMWELLEQKLSKACAVIVSSGLYQLGLAYSSWSQIAS